MVIGGIQDAVFVYLWIGFMMFAVLRWAMSANFIWCNQRQAQQQVSDAGRSDPERISDKAAIARLIGQLDASSRVSLQGRWCSALII